MLHKASPDQYTPPPGTGVPLPLGRDLGPVTEEPPERTWNQWKYYGMEMGTPRKDMGPVEVLWDGDGYPPRKDMGPVEVLWDGVG